MALVADSFPPSLVRDHRFTGLPSADIAAFHLSKEGQLLLGSSRFLVGEQGIEMQSCVEGLTVVFELESCLDDSRLTENINLILIY